MNYIYEQYQILWEYKKNYVNNDVNRIESEEIEEEIDVDFDTKSQHATRKGIEESGEDLDQEENNQLEVDIAEDFGEKSDSSIPSHIEINDIEKTDYNEYYSFDAYWNHCWHVQYHEWN